MKNNLKVSVITTVYNREDTIRDCINSVLEQDYENIEYIVVDAKSTDNTSEIIRSYGNEIHSWIREDDDGIYDGLNKGIKKASGDIIGLLNSDDFYADNRVISKVVRTFETDRVDSVFGDLVFVDKGKNNKVVRYYSSKNFTPAKFPSGRMPAHPTFFVSKKAYERYGLFKTDYKIAADFELLARFLSKHSLSYSYIPEVMVRMRTGGVSTKNLKSNWTLNREIIRACKENGISTNMLKVLSKYMTKIFQLAPGRFMKDLKGAQLKHLSGPIYNRRVQRRFHSPTSGEHS